MSLNPMLPPCGPEELLGREVLAYLRARGWHCMCEVEIINGAPTDIVAIRQRRLAIIELKPRLSAPLWEQMQKYNFLRWGYGARVFSISRQGKHYRQGDYTAWTVLLFQDGQLQQRIEERLEGGVRHTWYKPRADLMPTVRESATLERYGTGHWHAGPPVDARILSMFSGIPECDGAGSPTGSKHVSQVHLACNFARAYPQKIAGLNALEAAHLMRMWLRDLPNNFGEAMVHVHRSAA